MSTVFGLDGSGGDGVGSVARNKKRSTALSCAECRRLKLKCDRKFPCSACLKRGCSQICPDGSLTTGKGNRFVLANTEILHEKISELSHRVRSLEDALRVAHRAISIEQHPLLSDELLKIKHPMEREVAGDPAPRQTEEEDAIDAVGSLSISESGRSNFFGQTASSWHLLKNEEGDRLGDVEDDTLPPSADIPWLSHAFPFTPTLNLKVAEELRAVLIGSLPDAPTAKMLADKYFANAAWMYSPISETQFHQLIFARVYPYSSTDAASPSSEVEEDRDAGSYESHRLGLLYITLAVGTLVDLDRPSYDPNSLRYFQLSRAALSIDPIMVEPSITAIQTLVIMCHFMFLSDIDSQRWTLMGLAIKLAQSIGLHRDSERWNLSFAETSRRRELFWELYVYDSWQSFTYGRPPSLSMAHIDCKMAQETIRNDAGQVEMRFEAWKHRFSSECLSIVHDQVFGARTPTYATVMELDKRIRQYYVPPSLQVPGFNGASYNVGGGMEAPSMALTMQRHTVLSIKEATLLYMHRGFFAKAISDHPEDPLSGKYGHSVLRAHESASFLVSLVQSLWTQCKQLTERNWFLFTHVFSCAVVLGSIATLCPGLSLARSALDRLDQAYDLFQKVGEKQRAAKVLAKLSKIRDRAHASMKEYQEQMSEAAYTTKRESPQLSIGPRNDEELLALGGKTRFVSPKLSTSPPSPSWDSASPASSPGMTRLSPRPSTPTSPAMRLQQSVYPNANANASTMQSQARPASHQHVVYHHSPDMALFHQNASYMPEHVLPQPIHVQQQPPMLMEEHTPVQQQWQESPSPQSPYGQAHYAPMPMMVVESTHNGMHGNYNQGTPVNAYSQQSNAPQPVDYYNAATYGHGSTSTRYPYPYSQGFTLPHLESPQEDLSGAWQNLIAQYDSTNTR